jgi:hypothetical protein
MIQHMGGVLPRRTSILERIRALVGRLGVRLEPVELVEQRYNFLPQRFRWRGNVMRVRHVMKVWEQDHTATRPPRRYFQVVCHDGGSRVLFQDLRLGTWHLSV